MHYRLIFWKRLHFLKKQRNSFILRNSFISILASGVCEKIFRFFVWFGYPSELQFWKKHMFSGLKSILFSAASWAPSSSVYHDYPASWIVLKHDLSMLKLSGIVLVHILLPCLVETCLKNFWILSHWRELIYAVNGCGGRLVFTSSISTCQHLRMVSNLENQWTLEWNWYTLLSAVG